MRTLGISRAVLAVVLTAVAACVAEPGSSGLPVASTAPFETVPPSSTVPASPSPTRASRLPVASPTTLQPTPGPAPSPTIGATILTASGTTSERFGPFEADEDWAIAWERDGSRLFSVQLIPADVDVFGELVVSTTELEAGSSPMYRPGRFVGQVHASEPWTIRIIDFLPVPVRSIPAELAGTGPSNTDRFAVEGRFLLEWTVDRAAPFDVELVTMTTGEPLLLVAGTRTRSSCVEVSVADEFYLHVVTDAGWTMTLRPVGGETVCPAE